MSRKMKTVDSIWLDLLDGLERLSSASLTSKKFWYWEYYKSIEKDIKDAEERRRIYQQIYHLERFGYVSKEGFTKKGILRALKLKAKHKDQDDRDNWDNKWRVVIFDIPEKKRRLRNHLRVFLVDSGYKLLQNSIWINPTADFDEIQRFVKSLNIEKYVVLLIVEKISNDLLFKGKFKLN